MWQSNGRKSKPILYFVRGGHVGPGYYLYGAGAIGYYWSSTPYSNAGLAYFLNFDDTGVNPSRNDNSRFNGYSLRCLAR